MMARSHDTSCRRPREHAFSIIEVIVAVLVLAIVVVGATAMFGSSTRATSMARVHDKQTAVANEALAKLQADAGWALVCRRQQTPWNPNRADCNLNSWIQDQPHLRDIGVVRDSGGQVYRFSISAMATGVDLPADRRYPNDVDGVVPDMYRLRVTIAPNSELLTRFPKLQPTTLQQETNPTLRVQTGRLVINACVVVNQIDERVAPGDCSSGPASADVLPPAKLDTTNSSTIQNTCRGNSGITGSGQRDCTSYKCSEESIARPNPGLVSPCSSHAGWNGNVFAHPFSDDFTRMRIQPASGTVVLRAEDGTVYRKRLVNGTAVFSQPNDLPVGRYRVTLNVPGYLPWKSKSVPDDGMVGVEAGLTSRAVLMFRPRARSTVRVNVHSVDSSGPPWLQRFLPGYVKLSESGAIIQGGTERILLMPVPVGRIRSSEVPYVDVRLSTSTTQFVWRNVEPGLYSFQLTDPGFTAYKSVSNTAGFVYVFADGRPPYYGESSEPAEWVNGLCAKDVRAGWVAGGPIANPDTGEIWRPTPCDSPSGPGGASGAGGGGTS